jgi:DsbC/DsbD-like thiol-disulfide interchange protein/cytochrome c biogenesis protein CcdA
MRASQLPLPGRVLTSLLLILAALLAAPASVHAQFQPQARSNHIAAELIPEGPAIPGETVTLAIRFTPEPGWHGYWSNPGDAGYGMELDWSLPEGWSAGEPQYPVPERLLIAGLMNHVYEADYAVLVPLSVPPGSPSGPIMPIEVDAEWLACTDKVCVPEGATLTLRLATSGTTIRDPRFDEWRSAIPALLADRADFELIADRLRLAIPLPASLELTDPHVFIEQPQLIDYAAPQSFFRDGDTLIVEIQRKGIAEGPESIGGILKIDDSGQGVRFLAERGTVPAGGTPLGGTGTALAPLWLLLGGALLGGLLLNVMPCVFPILSLKALSLARAGESEAGARREGVAYTAGVILATLAVGALLLVLRAGGNEIGWAFQLQEPGVVVALLVLATAITANLAGLYELPSLSITRPGGRSSAFATGLLAAFVATPCTGPFMAAAMGAALLLPWWQALLLFATLGLGLALPFLLLGFVPAFRRMLPKPGKWMDTFRRVLAIPMGLTALALLWLAARLAGAPFAFIAAVVAVFFTVLLVLAGRWRGAGRSTLAPLLLGTAALAAFAAVMLPRFAEDETEARSSLLEPVPFSEARLAEARASGQPVFVWFTADWCVTCKVNESLAIEREATRAAFERAGVIAMRGDWTRRDPEITRFLTDHGAAGVPLYLWYPAGGEAQQLPQVLTPDSLVDLAQAGGTPAS